MSSDGLLQLSVGVAACGDNLHVIDAGVPVIDVSADFRLKRVEEYEARP
jgi:N-acetyl-gamma-glutamylphosphate reductase